jgi:hypothetical protein
MRTRRHYSIAVCSLVLCALGAGGCEGVDAYAENGIRTLPQMPPRPHKRQVNPPPLDNLRGFPNSGPGIKEGQVIKNPRSWFEQLVSPEEDSR